VAFGGEGPHGVSAASFSACSAEGFQLRTPPGSALVPAVKYASACHIPALLWPDEGSDAGSVGSKAKGKAGPTAASGVKGARAGDASAAETAGDAASGLSAAGILLYGGIGPTGDLESHVYLFRLDPGELRAMVGPANAIGNPAAGGADGPRAAAQAPDTGRPSSGARKPVCVRLTAASLAGAHAAGAGAAGGHSLGLLRDGPTPGARAYHSACSNASGTQMVVFGGMCADAGPSGVAPAAPSSPRAAAGAATSRAAAGGAPSSSTSVAGAVVAGQGGKRSLRNDVWVLDTAAWTWSSVQTLGIPPAPRARCAAVSSVIRLAASAAPARLDVRPHAVVPGVLDGPAQDAAGAFTAGPEAQPPEALLVFGGICSDPEPAAAAAGDRDGVSDPHVYALIFDDKLAAASAAASSTTSPSPRGEAPAAAGPSAVGKPPSASVGGKGKPPVAEAAPTKLTAVWGTLPLAAQEKDATDLGPPGSAAPSLARFGHCAALLPPDAAGCFNLFVGAGINPTAEAVHLSEAGAAASLLPHLALQFVPAAVLSERARAAQAAAAHAAAAEPDGFGGKIVKRVDGGCVVVRRPLPGLGSYEGEADAASGHLQGRGTFRFSASPSWWEGCGDLTGAEYVGGWLASKMHGQGTLQLADGTVYEGSFVAGLCQGTGSMEWPVGRTFASSASEQPSIALPALLDFAAVPMAESATPRSTLQPAQLPVSCSRWPWRRYEGEWQAGRPRGSGLVHFSNGAQYVGTVADGDAAGAGRLTCGVPVAEYCAYRSAAFRGKGASGEAEGAAPISSVDGAALFGDAVAMRLSGLDGSLTLVAEGAWVSGALDGDACSVAVSGPHLKEVHTGAFRAGLRHGVGVSDDRDGEVYRGAFHAGKRNGFGALRLADGSRYDGKFVGGVRCGRGTMVHADGSVYVGSWLDDKAHGEGVLRTLAGRESRGVWIGGTLRP